ncbi:PA2169 family four-helix-bundle protein [Fulvivirga sediminis]|uniref:PA2169 family four-helix-bundle protein n=1 Tax=Fulvivirga sediminis TaxID=2803949 RepID=A0A937F9V1_9BACT|nr:PA2169 family four-helix-bundle protein [Fulvivirga sediminis]MBL3658355.1 PA2169 family four-helix-bundle protein [Fulvivirga sediminis]
MTEKIDNIQTLIKINVEANEGYRTAASCVNDGLLSTFLNNNAIKRKEFAAKLMEKAKLKEVKSGLSSDLHKVWMEIKSAPKKFNGKAVLEECEKGEKHALKEYDKVLSGKDFPKDLADILEIQKREIKSNLEEISSLKKEQKEEDANRNRETPVP